MNPNRDMHLARQMLRAGFLFAVERSNVWK
jgi:hypothetical protein